MIRRIDARTAAVLLGSREKTLAFAQLLREEAAQTGDSERSRLLLERAAELTAQIAS